VNHQLRRELRDLGLVAAGAIPGALLRWQLELAMPPQAILLANLIGCLLIGVLLGQPSRRDSLYLWGGIGFSGSLTTFSSWMLELVRQLETGRSLVAALQLAVSLMGGLALVQLGSSLAARRWR
jgi:CrcB protein